MFSRSDHYLFLETRCSLLCSLFLLSDFQGLIISIVAYKRISLSQILLIFLGIIFACIKAPSHVFFFIYLCIHYPGSCGSTFCFMALQGSGYFFDIPHSIVTAYFSICIFWSAVYDFQFQVQRLNLLFLKADACLVFA